MTAARPVVLWRCAFCGGVAEREDPGGEVRPVCVGPIDAPLPHPRMAMSPVDRRDVPATARRDVVVY